MPNRDYHQERREYQYSGLSREQLQGSPFSQFTQWMDEAMQAAVQDPTAMSVATVDANGQPHSRIVLLKEFNQNGFVFYTHYDSNKGQQILASPKASLLFFWPEMDRQIRIEGLLSKTSLAESQAYFHSRPKESQIAAFTSSQSREVASRSTLEAAFAENTERFANSEVPHPAHWGGYRLTAHKFEFWQGRPNRLHDRFSYSLEAADAWHIARLSP